MIQIKSLCKYYSQGEETVKALNGVTLNINDNEYIAVIGKSGSGKSTLLNIIGGVDIPTSGTVEFEGKDIASFSKKQLIEFRRKSIGFIFQNYNLIPELNGKQNIVFPAMLAYGKYDEEYFRHITDTLEISHRLTHLPSEMSGGQQQRIAIARAFINKPRLILCDEPTGNLDSDTSKRVIELIKKLKTEYKMTVITVTHEADVAKNADRIITLSDGKVVL